MDRQGARSRDGGSIGVALDNVGDVGVKVPGRVLDLVQRRPSSTASVAVDSDVVKGLAARSCMELVYMATRRAGAKIHNLQ